MTLQNSIIKMSVNLGSVVLSNFFINHNIKITEISQQIDNEINFDSVILLRYIIILLDNY